MGIIKGLGLFLAGAAAGAGGLFVYQSLFPKDEVFRGPIGEWGVSYRERGKEGNLLLAKKGSLVIEYTDRDPEAFINSPASRPFQDTVDIIVYRDDKGTETYHRSDIGSHRFEPEVIKGIFESGDKQYNLFRGEIRKGRNKEISDRLNEINKGINK